MDRQIEFYSVLWVENHWSILLVLGAKRSYLELSSSELRWFLKVCGNIQTTWHSSSLSSAQKLSFLDKVIDWSKTKKWGTKKGSSSERQSLNISKEKHQSPIWFDLKSVFLSDNQQKVEKNWWFRAVVSDTRPAGRMWPAWYLCAARVIIKNCNNVYTKMCTNSKYSNEKLLFIDKNSIFSVEFCSYVVLKQLNTSTAARGHIFKSICGPRALFSSKCGPRIDLSLRSLI